MQDNHTCLLVKKRETHNILFLGLQCRLKVTHEKVNIAYYWQDPENP